MRYVFFYNLIKRCKEKLSLLNRKKLEEFHKYLAFERNFAASTQNQTINALVFLYKRVLESTFENIKVTCSPKEERVLVVLTREEVKQVLSLLDGIQELVVKLLYVCCFGIN